MENKILYGKFYMENKTNKNLHGKRDSLSGIDNKVKTPGASDF